MSAWRDFVSLIRFFVSFIGWETSAIGNRRARDKQP
jgi:hypothetical protein